MVRRATVDEMRFLIRAGRTPRIRPILQFAEEELVIPEGVHEGSRFRSRTLPWQRLWLAEIDRGIWNRFFLTACVQNGKTLVGWVLPILWHVFERRENWGAAVPSMDVAYDKWRLELLPAILRNPRFRKLLPDRGRGSQGGVFESITFRNGVTLKFLSGHGGDEKRSSITLAGSAITEADRMDEAGERSREAAPVYQIEARSASYGAQARLYAECTPTVTSGFMARERREGSMSTIMCPCPHCGEYVCPEREHLVGWRDAASEVEAMQEASWVCPHCGVIIEETQRREMNERAVLVHRGQTIGRDGVVMGDMPATRTLSFRANAFHNLLWDTSYIAAEEWKASRDRDQESAERKMLQWYWARECDPHAIDITPLEMEDVLSSQSDDLRRGVVPAGTFAMSGAADVRKTQVHFVVIAWQRREQGVVVGHFIDLGVVPVESAKFGTRKAIHQALGKLRDEIIEPGYLETAANKRWRPGWFAVDAFWEGVAVRRFIRDSVAQGIKRYIPSFGRGFSAEHSRARYRHPNAASPKKPHVGQGYYVAWDEAQAMHHLVVSADEWKSFVREGFSTPPDQPGALVTFQATTEDEQRLLRSFAQQIVAEKVRQIHVPGRGMKLVFVNEAKRSNHFGDAAYNACATGHLCGVRIIETAQTATPAPVERSVQPMVKPFDQRPYLLSSRED